MSQQFVVQGGMLVAVIRPTIFRNYEDYVRDMKKLKMRIKSSKPAKGFKEVLLPGEPEERIAEERKKKGIPLDEGTIEELSRVAKELNIDPLKEIG
jgi:LDH2 family malate/lactate/ureidoglycolate dehydrogenase